MFSIVFKGNNPFATARTRSLIIFFNSSFDLLYVIILLKNVEIDLGVTTFQTLELCFS
jgi:hypothetical protein